MTSSRFAGPVVASIGLAASIGLVACSEGNARTDTSTRSTAPAKRAPRVESARPPAFVERTFEDGFLDVDATTFATRLRERPERLVLVNVWSTWCEPCREEMPALVRVARGFRDRGVGLVLVAADAPSNRAAAITFLRESGAAAPGWFKVGSDDAFVRAVHPDWSGALPFTMLLDRDRRPIRTWPEPIVEGVLREAIETTLSAP